MKKNLLLLVFCFLIFSVYAQLVDLGAPRSFTTDISIENLNTNQMESFDLQAMQYQDSISDYHKVGPWRFGKNFEVDYNINNSGTWTNLPNGDRIWQLRISSPGALTMNVIFDKYYLPEGANMYMYNKSKEDVVGAYTSILNNPDSIIGSELVAGEDIIIEYFEPASVIGEGLLSIGTITHGYRSLNLHAENLLRGLNDSGNCNIDVGCPLGDGWEQQINSVAMIVVNGNGSCSGALINNTENDGTPYFLTANHCLGNPANWVYRFNWNSPNPSCATTTPSSDGSFNQTMFNGQLRASNAGSDMALVELNNPIPNSWNPFYAGWDRSGNIPNFTVGIHHPRGDIKKICKDNDAPYYDTNGGAQVWWIDEWEEGVTEPGSSGSPLFDDNKRIIGQLYGGLAACSGTNNNGQFDYYGRFDVSWDGSNASSRLRDWLDPNNTGAIINDGYDPNVILVDNDASISNIVAPSGDVCGGSIAPVVTLRNFGNNNLTQVTIEYSLNGGSTQSFNWSGNLATNETEELTLPSLSLNMGNNNLSVATNQPNNQNDENTTNDEASTSFSVDMLANPSVNIPNNICNNTNFTLTATPNANGNIQWFENEGNVNPDFTGNTLNLNLNTGTYNYYMQEVVDTTSQNVGPTDFFNGGFFLNTDRFLYFDALDDIVLKSVKVNADGGGNRIIELRNQNGNVLQSATVNIPNGESRVTLNFEVAAGTNYQLGLGGNTNGLWRTDDANNINYPYVINDLVSITESDVGVNFNPPIPNRYYYSFYDWEVSKAYCSSTRQAVNVVVNNCSGNAPEADFEANVTTICAGESINFTDLSTESPSSVEWSFPGGSPSTSSNANPTITYDATGVYSVSLTATNNAGSDQETKTSYITVLAAPNTTINGDNEICEGETSTLIGNINNGGGTVTSYLWTKNGNNIANSNLPNLEINDGGNYTLTVTNTNNCSVTTPSFQVTLVDFNLSVNTTDALCNQNNGSASASVSGNISNYSFLWNTTPPQTTSEIQNLSGGSYTVKVTNNLTGCEKTETVTINNADGPEIDDLVVVNGDCNSGLLGSATISVSGGAPPYQYDWGNGFINENNTNNLSSGNYTVVVKDQNDCTNERNFTISNTGNPVISLSSLENESCSGLSDGNLNIDISGGSGDYDVLWSHDNSSNLSLSNLSAGVYSVVVEDNNSGCNTQANFTIGQNFVILLDLVVLSAVEPGIIEATVIGGIEPFTYNWNNNTFNTPLIEGLENGVYTLQVTDNLGCSVMDSATIGGVSIQQIDELLSLSVYPNPTDKLLNVAVNFETNNDVEISVLNTLGQVIYRQKYQSIKNDILTIDVSNFSTSTYFLKIKTGQQNQTISFIKF